MNKEKIKQIVLDIIAEIAPDEDLSDVKPEVRLRDQLDLDSMDFLDIVMELRKQHGIDVPAPKKSLRSSHNWCWSVWTFRRPEIGDVWKKSYYFRKTLCSWWA